MEYKTKHSIEQMWDALHTDAQLQYLVDCYLSGVRITAHVRTPMEETASFIKYKNELLYGMDGVPIKAGMPVPTKWPENPKYDPHMEIAKKLVPSPAGGKTDVAASFDYARYQEGLANKNGDVFGTIGPRELIPVDVKSFTADVRAPNKWPAEYSKEAWAAIFREHFRLEGLLDPHKSLEKEQSLLGQNERVPITMSVDDFYEGYVSWRNRLALGIDWGMGAYKTVLTTLELSQDEVQRRIVRGLGVPEEYLKPKPAALSEFNERLTDAIYKKRMEDRLERQFTPVEQVPPSREPEFSNPLHKRMWKEFRFARAYGMSWESLEKRAAHTLGLGVAKDLVERFKRAFPEAAKYTDHKSTPLDVDYADLERRVRAVQQSVAVDLETQEKERHKAALRAPIHKPRIQGTAADVVGMALHEPEPTDPEERALWKSRRFGVTYVMSPTGRIPVDKPNDDITRLAAKGTATPEAQAAHNAAISKLTQDMQDHQMLKRMEAVLREVYGDRVTILLKPRSVHVRSEGVYNQCAPSIASAVQVAKGEKAKIVVQIQQQQQVGPGDVDEEDPQIDEDYVVDDDDDEDYVDPYDVEPEPEDDDEDVMMTESDNERLERSINSYLDEKEEERELLQIDELMRSIKEDPGVKKGKCME